MISRLNRMTQKLVARVRVTHPDRAHLTDTMTNR
jgi:hypothetical protein